MNKQNKEQIKKVISFLIKSETVTIKQKKGQDANERNLQEWLNELAKNGIVIYEVKQDGITGRPAAHSYKLVSDWKIKLKQYYKKQNQNELRHSLDIRNYKEIKKANRLNFYVSISSILIALGSLIVAIIALSKGS